MNYNVRFFLEQCLLSVLKARGTRNIEVLVVDNHSTDGSKEYLFEKFPQVKFFWNPINEGFARANNEAIRAASGEFVLMLNPDTLLPEDFFDRCLSFLKLHPRCGGLGVRMIDGAGLFLPESKRNIPRWSNSFFKISGISRMFPRSSRFSGYYAQHIEEKSVAEVEILSGACMLVKREILYELGGFDMDFFMYGEDIDLSYRLLKAGYINYYLGDCTIVHFKGESSFRDSPKHLHDFYGAMNLFVHKHYRHPQKILLRSAIALSIFIANTRLWFQKLISSPIVKSKRETVFKLYPTSSYVIQTIIEEKNITINLTDTWPPYEGAVLLVEGKIGFADIIKYLEDNQGRAKVWISAAGSHSFVGSHHKHQRGQVMARSVDFR